MKKLGVLFLVLAMLAVACMGCAKTEPVESESSAPAVSESTPAESPSDEAILVGVTMPTKSLQRWNEDGANVQAALEAEGYKVDLQYADNKQEAQNTQIENQITMGCKLLIIASIDGGALGAVLEQAKEADIPVIAYDRLITGTDKCDYYATFDNKGVGAMQGQFIIDTLDLENTTETFTMECFGGSPDDNNAYLFNEGAMELLLPYIESGKLVVKSGEYEYPGSIAIQAWDPPTAQARMDNLLTAHYADENIDVVLSPNDSIAQGIVASLKQAGYGTADRPYPILTGQDCDKINVGQIIRGEQSMSIFKDTRILAQQVIAMAKALLAGETVPTNTEYDNGAIKVPSFNCEIQFANKDNWQTLLVDSGYYKLEDIPQE